MTIDKQKILKYIPIVQLITVFYWLKYYLTKKIPWSDFAKALLKIFAVLLFIHKIVILGDKNTEYDHC